MKALQIDMKTEWGSSGGTSLESIDFPLILHESYLLGLWGSGKGKRVLWKKRGAGEGES